MTVLLTVSDTWNGANYAELLEGGGTGIDLGSCINSQYAPLVNLGTNDGAKDVFISHDAVVDPVTDVKTYIQTFGVGTGFTYGGPNSAAADYTFLLDMGNTDNMGPAVANNSDGLGNGLHIDMDWDVALASQFLGSRKGGLKEVYGSSGGAASGLGRDLANAVPMIADAMVYTQGTGVETAPTGAVAGQIGRDHTVDAAEAALYGDRVHCRLRFYMRQDETEGGYLQWEWVIAYSFTA